MVFIGNQGEGQRRDSAQDLRPKDDVLTAEPIRQMAGWQRKRNYRDRDRQANEPKCSRRVRSCINLPFHRHCEHQSTGDRQQVPGCEEGEIAEPKRGVWIMGARFAFYREWNRGALPVRGSIGTRINGMRHARACRIKREPESRLSGQQGNPPRYAEKAGVPTTAVLPSRDPVRNSLKRRRFFFHFRPPMPKIGALKAKMDNIIEARELQIERKHFYVELRENDRGRFLRITEDAHARRNSIIVPSTGVQYCTSTIAEVLTNGDTAPA